MSHIEHHLAPPGMTHGNGCSHGVSASGRLVAIAGQVAMVGPGDPVAQTERVFENLGLALAAAGATFDIVKFGVYVTDMAILSVVREVRSGWSEGRPTSLAPPGVLELEREALDTDRRHAGDTVLLESLDAETQPE